MRTDFDNLQEGDKVTHTELALILYQSKCK